MAPNFDCINNNFESSRVELFEKKIEEMGESARKSHRKYFPLCRCCNVRAASCAAHADADIAVGDAVDA